MKEIQDISSDEMLQALSRSGYLLEAEISRKLRELDFFVETNLVIEDPITGKSREIDIAAEYYDWNFPSTGVKAKAKIEFVFEVKNNLYPLVLLNEFDFSPRVEDWMGLKEAITCPQTIKYDRYENYYESLIGKDREGIFSQYCSFQRKKQNEELMALHPENIHTGISKIVQYCEECTERWESDDEDHDNNDESYLRHFLYMPILLVNEGLYELKNGVLLEKDSSIVVVNYIRNNQPSMAYVFVVTKKGFLDFMSMAINLEKEVGEKLVELRKRNA
jgi:hypothetical protein